MQFFPFKEQFHLPNHPTNTALLIINSLSLMEGETRNVVIKVEAESDVEPISVQRCCSLVSDQSNERICRYKECRRNHAASIGRYAIDGCGEFICCKDDVFMCAACGCHRSFHRKDYLPPPPQPKLMSSCLAPLPLASHNGLTGETSLFVKDRNNTVAGPGAEEQNTNKEAKRTRLTVEQKNKMMRFADKLGWRSQGHDDAEIRQFCEQVGITKRVFVVWLNNNRRRSRKGSK
nr:hypothetical protein B456_008G044700 [Gossypium raimondii]